MIIIIIINPTRNSMRTEETNTRAIPRERPFSNWKFDAIKAVCAAGGRGALILNNRYD